MQELMIFVLPEKTMRGGDELRAADAFRQASLDGFILWQGDFQNAKHLLQALKRRIQTPPKKASSPAQSFHLHRQAQAERAKILGSILIPVNADFSVSLRRAPDLAPALSQVLPRQAENFYLRLRDILGLIGAYEWRKNGVFIEALGGRIHPYYGVFSPGRGEYLKLIAEAPLPTKELAFDIGTGTGVIAAVLAKRGVQKIVATDFDDQALACATENIGRFGWQSQIEIQKRDLFPAGKAALIVCNPPWIPEEPTAKIEFALYDPGSKMLKSFLNGLRNHLEDDGEAWLIISDIAEHLGLRSRDELLSWIEQANLKVAGRLETKPTHRKSKEAVDALSFARQKEITSLWRLQKK
jgi:predicted O-methyltransferase YrrM